MKYTIHSYISARVPSSALTGLGSRNVTIFATKPTSVIQKGSLCGTQPILEELCEKKAIIINFQCDYAQE